MPLLTPKHVDGGGLPAGVVLALGMGGNGRALRRGVQAEQENLVFVDDAVRLGKAVANARTAGVESEAALAFESVSAEAFCPAAQTKSALHRAGHVVVEIVDPRALVQPTAITLGRTLNAERIPQVGIA